MKLQHKILTSSIILMAALGLTGCATNSNTSTTTGQETSSAKVTKSAKSTKSTKSTKSAKKAASSSSQAQSSSVASSSSAQNENSTVSTPATSSSETAVSKATQTSTAPVTTTTTVTQPTNVNTDKVAESSSVVNNNENANIESQVVAQHVDTEEAGIINGLVQAAGLQQENGDQYTVTKGEDGYYQVDVRNSNGDPDVAHLKGIYQYNPTTNQYKTMDPTTGEFN